MSASADASGRELCYVPGRSRAERKERVTMKEKPNYAELEKQVDFKALAGRLDKLTEKDNRQRTTLVTLLDNLKEQLLEARQKRKVSYHTLAKELTDAGLKVSEPTLRKYMQAQGIGKKNRKKGAQGAEQWPRASAPPQRKARRPLRPRARARASRRAHASTASIWKCDRLNAVARRRPVVCHAACGKHGEASATPATRLPRQIKVSLSVPSSVPLPRLTTKDF